jgi:hypothetical protein
VVVTTLRASDWLLIDPTERKLGIWIGENRFRVDKARGCIPCCEQDDDRRLANDRFGAQAEVAVARALNVFPKIDIDHYWVFDLRTPSDEPFAVSWSPDGACLLDKGRNARHVDAGLELPEFYIVTTGAPPCFLFVGWATREAVLGAPEAHRGYGPCFALPPSALRPTLEILTPPKGAGYRR